MPRQRGLSAQSAAEAGGLRLTGSVMSSVLLAIALMAQVDSLQAEEQRIYTLEISHCEFHRMAGLLRQGHFLGTKLRALRKRNGLTLDELSARCVQLDAAGAPSVSYLSMIENGKRMPSADCWTCWRACSARKRAGFSTRTPRSMPCRRGASAAGSRPCRSSRRSCSRTSCCRTRCRSCCRRPAPRGRQFAQLLIRVWQETHHNDFPDIERAAEAGRRARVAAVAGAAAGHLQAPRPAVRWFDARARRKRGGPPLRSRFEAPGHGAGQPPAARAGGAAALRAGVSSSATSCCTTATAWSRRTRRSLGATRTRRAPAAAAWARRMCCYAWRDFECSFFAGALLCPRVPFRRFLVREAHGCRACRQARRDDRRWSCGA